MAIREPELEVGARIGVTPEAYEILRKLKAARKQSMIRIVSDLINATQDAHRKSD